ncbi:uncharacterized protein A4U43_C09F15910 [Asparagus officinalis]|uniref:Uncharacterized protein n=1 Tax=Asparagus officinalis TaxID=4686 RepID=A0A5P1E819_ASPOF|nr:uncharacterized protein A4U43_C09F15910 [Asparagus officinalis]
MIADRLEEDRRCQSSPHLEGASGASTIDRRRIAEGGRNEREKECLSQLIRVKPIDGLLDRILNPLLIVRSQLGSNLLILDCVPHVISVVLKCILGLHLLLVLIVLGLVLLRLLYFSASCTIFLILMVNVVVGVWQESNAEKALEALKEIQSEHAAVKRDGELVPSLPAKELVSGDIVVLRVGDKITTMAVSMTQWKMVILFCTSAVYMATFLVSRGANLEPKDEEGAIPLHDACAGGFIEIVQYIINSAGNADFVKRMLETTDAEGDMPLHHAARGEHLNVVHLLLQAGASPKTTNVYGMKPAELAESDPVRSTLEAAAATDSIISG